jgi:cysteine desulfurase
MGDELLYLDHAAATPMDERVLRAMQPYLTEFFYNPSSPYAPALQVRRDYEAAKQVIASRIGAKGDELVMTAGATESINLAFNSIGGHVVTAAIEHHAVLAAAKRYDHTIVESDERGLVTASTIKAALRPDTRLVSIALANNELGTVQPLRQIAAVIQTEREARRASGNTTPIYLHTDASQGAGE